jgi:predicted DNA-binding transcriptional regulator YafY
MMTDAQRRLLDQLHAACLERVVTEFRYTKLGEDETQAKDRRVRPLALTFWSGVWTLAAWCELRDDFRIFRIDRIANFHTTGEHFTQKRGQRLEDLSKLMRARAKAGDATPSLRLQGLG